MDLAQSCGMRRRGFVMYKLCDIDIFVCGAFLTLLFSLSSLAEIILWWETYGSLAGVEWVRFSISHCAGLLMFLTSEMVELLTFPL